jgi:fatty acid desaturase
MRVKIAITVIIFLALIIGFQFLSGNVREVISISSIILVIVIIILAICYFLLLSMIKDHRK